MVHKTYVTFGSNHTHSVIGKTLDNNCVAVIKSEGSSEGREMAFELFGPKFCMEYPEKYFDKSTMHFFPRGYVEVN